VAEESGLIVALGAWVLRTACRQVAEWAVPGLTLSVNISARQVAAEGLAETVAAVLAETGVPAGTLGLEITEGLLLEHNEATRATLAELKRLGVRLLLDDFGTGFSSLGYLRRYDLDLLKIDRSFVADLGEDGCGDAAIVEAIVGMARALGLSTVPEGVETEAQLARLSELGCDFAQGFHLGRPRGAAETAALLRALAS
jgi:EAL domain-containing protein (putative c-di-GMP-specific phosphodiesterase class I)